MNIAITITVALVGSMVFRKLKIPAGSMVGAIVFVAALNLMTDICYFPRTIKIVVQAIAGGFVGQRIARRDLKELKRTVKPAIQLFCGIIGLTFVTGLFIMAVSPLTINTALLSSMPGGVSDVALISADVGADATQTTLLQLVRYLIALLVLPQAAQRICEKFADKEDADHTYILGKKDPSVKTVSNAVKTITLALVAGGIGRLSHMPAGTLVFALIATTIRNIKTDGNTYFPIRLRYVAQSCAGALVGCMVTTDAIRGIHDLMLPAVIVAVNCVMINYLLGFWIYKTNPNLELSTCLFASLPAGLSDMALLSMELGGDAPKVAILQLVRYFATMAILPTLISLVAYCV